MKWISSVLIAVAGICAAQPEPPASKQKIDAIFENAVNVMWERSDHYWHEGEHFHIMRLLYLVIELDPQYLEAYSNLAWLLDSNDKDSAAIAVYRRSITNNPTDWEPLYDLGFYYFNTKKFDLALDPLQKSVARNPKHLNPWRLLAHCYEKLGKLTESVETWDKIIAMAPDDVPAKNNRARVAALAKAKVEK